VWFQALKKLSTFLRSLGVKAVFDTSCSRDLTLIESCEEFVRRFKSNQGNGAQHRNLPILTSSCPGTAGNFDNNIMVNFIILAMSIKNSAVLFILYSQNSVMNLFNSRL
jgi:hypothetical protein